MSSTGEFGFPFGLRALPSRRRSTISHPPMLLPLPEEDTFHAQGLGRKQRGHSPPGDRQLMSAPMFPGAADITTASKQTFSRTPSQSSKSIDVFDAARASVSTMRSRSDSWLTMSDSGTSQAAFPYTFATVTSPASQVHHDSFLNGGEAPISKTKLFNSMISAIDRRRKKGHPYTVTRAPSPIPEVQPEPSIASNVSEYVEEPLPTEEPEVAKEPEAVRPMKKSGAPSLPKKKLEARAATNERQDLLALVNLFNSKPTGPQVQEDVYEPKSAFSDYSSGEENDKVSELPTRVKERWRHREAVHAARLGDEEGRYGFLFHGKDDGNVDRGMKTLASEADKWIQQGQQYVEGGSDEMEVASVNTGMLTTAAESGSMTKEINDTMTQPTAKQTTLQKLKSQLTLIIPGSQPAEPKHNAPLAFDPKSPYQTKRPSSLRQTFTADHLEYQMAFPSERTSQTHLDGETGKETPTSTAEDYSLNEYALRMLNGEYDEVRPINPMASQMNDTPTTFLAGSIGSPVGLGIGFQHEHNLNEGDGRWEVVRNSDEPSAYYPGYPQHATVRSPMSPVYNRNSGDVIPPPLQIRKGQPGDRSSSLYSNDDIHDDTPAAPKWDSPVLPCTPSFPQLPPSASSAFVPRRTESWDAKIKAISEQQRGKLGSHPALRDLGMSTNDDVSPTSNIVSPLTSSDEPKLDRVDSGLGLSQKKETDEGYGTGTVRQREFGLGRDARPVSIAIDVDNIIEQWEWKTQHANQKPSGAVSGKVEIQELRNEVGLPPLCYVFGQTGLKHPNHPFEWDNEKVMCIGHNPKGVLPQMPKIPENKTVNMNHMGSQYFKPKPVKEKLKAKKCSSCGSFCCRFTNLIAISKTMSGRDVQLEASRLKAENQVKMLRSRYPNGIEEYDTFLRCDHCGEEICPKCAKPCTERLCSSIVCDDCRAETDVCPVHSSF